MDEELNVIKNIIIALIWLLNLYFIGLIKKAKNKMGKINKEWHLKNKMLKNPSFEDRVEWHRKHNKNCKCREGEDYLEKLKEEAKKRGIKL